jgi:hypothetical protein
MRTSSAGIVKAAVVVGTALMTTVVTPAGGQCPYPNPRVSKSAVRQYAREAEAAWRAADDSLKATRQEMATRLSRDAVIAGPMKDEFGDPMYTEYGPRAYAHSPFYGGPAYTASFARPLGVVLPDSQHRGAIDVPGPTARYGNATAAGATQSYLQSGMISSRGMTAPSGARPAMFNN